MANSSSSGMTLNALEQRFLGRVRTGSNRYFLGLVLTGLVMLVGAAAGLHSTVGGHHAYYNVSREVPWGILIATYIFFVITSTGLCIVSSIGHIFGVQSFMPIAKRSVFLAIVTLLAGFFVITAEIKVPIRMLLYNIISPNPTSNIWWMGTLYGVALMVMSLEFIFLNLNKHKLAVICGFTALVAELAANSNLAAVFGLLNGRDFWHGPYLPLFFIASAVMMGASAIIFFHILAHRLQHKPLTPEMAEALAATRKVAILGICIVLFFTIWRSVATLAGEPNGQYAGIVAMVDGPFALSFWGGEIFLALLAPLGLYLLSQGRRTRLMLTAAALMIIGVFFMRYNMVVVGQVIPAYQGLGVNGAKGLLQYSPSLHEILVTLGGFGLTGFLFLLGEKIFAGHQVDGLH
jgi:molybdopterin-containing oxidoreductase family membrane subunit